MSDDRDVGGQGLADGSVRPEGLADRSGSRKGWQMSPAAIGLIILFLVVGCALGWFSQKTQAANSDVKVAKTRLAGGRRTRWRSALLALVIGIVVLLAFKDVIRVR